MKRLHFYSGLVLTLFIGFHLLNHLSSVWGAETHLLLMDRLRLVYRNILVETILLAAVVLQIVTGLRLFWTTRFTKEGFYPRMQLWTGLYLAVFLLIHVGAVLVGRSVLQLDTNLYFGAVGLNTFPVNLFFVPYYGLAILAFFGHLAAIHYQKMTRTVWGVSVQRQSAVFLGLGIIISLLALHGLTGGFTGLDIPPSYYIVVGK